MPWDQGPGLRCPDALVQGSDLRTKPLSSRDLRCDTHDSDLKLLVHDHDMKT
jgi:hypothetical protein